MTLTDTDVHYQVRQSLDGAPDVTPDDIETITREIVARYGPVDIDTLDNYWAIVAALLET